MFQCPATSWPFVMAAVFALALVSRLSHRLREGATLLVFFGVLPIGPEVVGLVAGDANWWAVALLTATALIWLGSVWITDRGWQQQA